MSVIEAVRRDLAALAERDPALAESALAMTMEAMADRLDNGGGSPSECAKALIDAWSRLRELAPPAEVEDGVDGLAASRSNDLERQRKKRKAGA
jgi:hypothetical protein